VLYSNFKELRLPKSAAASGAAYFLPFGQKIPRNLLLFHHCKSFGNPRSARNWRRIAPDE
jgi:hypothetical protein